MRGFALAVCLLAMTAETFGQNPQNPNNPFGPGVPGGPGAPGVPGAPGGPGVAPQFDPRGKSDCARFFVKEKDRCYLKANAAFLRGTYTVANSNGVSQIAANDFCASKVLGATLVTVSDLQENDFLYEWVLHMTTEPQHVWIGLYADAAGVWQWFSGEPTNFTNWDLTNYEPPVPGSGAVLFEAEPLVQSPNHVDISGKWRVEDPLNEPAHLICEYKLQPNAAPADPVTQPPRIPTTPLPAMTTQNAPLVPQAPNSPQGPALYNAWNRPMNMGGFMGGRFANSQLYEVPRQPANYRMQNPYYAMP